MNYEFKGTPTPWVVEISNQIAWLWSTRPVGAKENIVCHRSLADDCKQEVKYRVVADFNLLSAAPDLLQALISIEEWNVQQAIDQYGDASKADNWACVVAARQAIRKALNITP
mgnify:CR=1 FL=1